MEKVEENKKNLIKKQNEIETYLLFKQLMFYFNFHKKFEQILANGTLETENNINDYFNLSIPKQKNETNVFSDKFSVNKWISNKFCLIDKNWIKEWKKYIGYSEIVKSIKNIIKEEDYDKIKNIIKRNTNIKRLISLDMSDIYKNNNLDIFSNFDIFLVNYFEQYISEEVKNVKEIKKCYSILISKEKYFIKLDNFTCQIVFLEKESKKYNELLILIENKDQNVINIIKELQKEDINNWLKEIDFKINNEFKKQITKFNTIFILINKTLQLKSDLAKKSIYNSVNPSNHLIKETFKKNLSNSIKQSKLIETTIKENFDYFKIIQNLNPSSKRTEPLKDKVLKTEFFNIKNKIDKINTNIFSTILINKDNNENSQNIEKNQPLRGEKNNNNNNNNNNKIPEEKNDNYKPTKIVLNSIFSFNDNQNQTHLIEDGKTKIVLNKLKKNTFENSNNNLNQANINNNDIHDKNQNNYNNNINNQNIMSNNYPNNFNNNQNNFFNNQNFFLMNNNLNNNNNNFNFNRIQNILRNKIISIIIKFKLILIIIKI